MLYLLWQPPDPELTLLGLVSFHGMYEAPFLDESENRPRGMEGG